MKPLLILIWLSLSTIAMAVPYELIDTGSYRDGGTVWAKLKSSSGEIHEICIDRRIKSPTHLEIFTGATYPTKEKAKIAIESDRAKLVFILKKLTASDPEKHARLIQVLKEHEKSKNSGQAASGKG